MTRLTRTIRRQAQENGDFRTPSGWKTVGLGRRDLTRGQGRAGSRGFDNAFRLGTGIVFATALAFHLILPAPERIQFSVGDTNIPAVRGAVFGFLLALLPAFLVSRARRVIPWLFWLGFFGALGGILLVDFLFSP